MKRRNSRIRELGALLAFAGLIVTPRAEAPLTLSDAMHAALQRSEEAQIMAEKETKLEVQKREVLAGVFPNVQLYADAGRGAEPFYTKSIPAAAFGGGGNGGGGFASTQDVYNVQENHIDYGVQVVQPIYSFGRVGQAYKVAGMLQSSLAESNHRSRQQLALQALDAYYNVVTTRARLNVINASIKRQGEAVAFLESNFKMGSGQRSAVLLATSALKALEPMRIRAESDADAARMMLNRFLGRPVQEPLELDTVAAMELGTTPADTSESGIQNILEQRPDLASMRLQKEALLGYAEGYRMLYRPSLGLQGKLGILAFQPNAQLHDFNNDLEWQIGVGFQWPIFDGFAQSSKAKEYESDARSLTLSERQARDFARIEIENALREAAASDTAYEAAREARDAAGDAQQLLEEDFRSGKGQVTDLLTAEEELRNAEFGVLGARYQKVRAQAVLRMALGRDLIEEGSK